ncbi:MAG: hypothetical protein K0S48_54 [Ramlibacter sp.]|jgi:hypothetical protein|nr:hypothetical protein [Ramlibacter sp.]
MRAITPRVGVSPNAGSPLNHTPGFATGSRYRSGLARPRKAEYTPEGLTWSAEPGTKS